MTNVALINTKAKHSPKFFIDSLSLHFALLFLKILQEMKKNKRKTRDSARKHNENDWFRQDRQNALVNYSASYKKTSYIIKQQLKPTEKKNWINVEKGS